MRAQPEHLLPTNGARPDSIKPVLEEALRHALREVKDLLRFEAASRYGERDRETVLAQAAFAQLDKRLAEIEGALRFVGAESPAALLALMRQLAAAQPADTSWSDAFVSASNAACDALSAALSAALFPTGLVQAEQSARAAPAALLMPAWQALAALMPGQPPTPAALISLDATFSAEVLELLMPSQPALSRIAEVDSRQGLDSALLDVLRAEAGSDRWCHALRQIAATIATFCPFVPDERHRLHWIVMRVFCEQLAVDEVPDLAQAKRILSAVVRLLRHRLPEKSPAPGETLVREALYQISQCRECERPGTQSLMLCEGYRLRWQLGWSLGRPLGQPLAQLTGQPSEVQPGAEPGIDTRCDCAPTDPLRLDALREPVDELMSGWASLPVQARRCQLDQLAHKLTLEPAFASLAQTFAKAVGNLPEDEDLLVAASLVVLHESIDVMSSRSMTEGGLLQAMRALERIAALSADAAVSVDQRWNALHATAVSVMRPASRLSLRAAVRTSLRDTEQRLDALLEQGEHATAASGMHQVLSIAAGALTIAGQTEALAMSASLCQRLVDFMQRDDLTAADFHALATDWVQLCARIDEWEMSDTAQRTLISPEPDNLTPSEVASPAGTNSLLAQIFVQEAAQRLNRLRRMLTDWASDPTCILPAEAAHDAHALAGSSATVGLMHVHHWALALEQVLERLIYLDPADQSQYQEVVLQGLQVLERQLCAGHDAAQANDTGSPEALHQLARDLDAMHETPDQHTESVPLRLPAGDSGRENEDSHDARQTAIDCEICTEDPSMTTDASRTDPELLALFTEEAAELMPQLEQLLSHWHQSPSEKSLQSEVLRLLHTLKGSARMAGEMSLGERLHRMEHEVAQLPLTDEAGHAGIAELRQEVRQLLALAGLPGLPLIPAMPAMPALSDLPDQALSSDAERSLPGCVPDEALSRVDARDARDAQRSGAMPKVRFDLLERASATAAELLVGAVRAAADLQQQRQIVAELAENLARLRTQLRELELQSESRIAAQDPSQNSGDASVASLLAFDPLEFDRYTRLQELTRMTAESLADLTSVQRSLARQTDAATTALSQQTRHARLLQSDLRRAGMQAFAGIEPRLRHLVRQTAAETGRDVRFALDGGQIEIDRLQLDRLNGALQHLIRNAIVHGIEPPAQRESAGKPRCGLVRLSLSQQGSELRLQVSDDGRGLDLARIHERAIAQGLLPADSAADDPSLDELIFAPGLSTADDVTELAGRGIGMDAVKAAVIHMGGALKVDSLPGAGTCITLALPQLLSTQQVVVVADSDQRIALPAALVQQLIQLSTNDARDAMEKGSIEWQRQSMPLRSLAALLGGALQGGAENVLRPAQRVSIIVLRQLDQWLALKVDIIEGHREVIVKQAGLQLATLPGLSGATLLPDGSVLLVMNPLQLHEQSPDLRAASDRSTVGNVADKAPLVMVVDDSLTVRRVSQRLLERHGYSVALARHGVEALEQLRELTPAAMLLDIEMPRMDGFELLSRLRADERLRSVPVAMITSRTAERHRQHAMTLGANAYFGKPYREQELFEWLGLCAPVFRMPDDGAQQGAGDEGTARGISASRAAA